MGSEMCIRDSSNSPHAVDELSINLFITPYGTNTAGETYSLQCSSSADDHFTFIWLDSRYIEVPSEMVTTVGGVSTLTFNPMVSSHAGTYTCTCTATLRSVTQYSSTAVNVTVKSKFSTLSNCID